MQVFLLRFEAFFMAICLFFGEISLFYIFAAERQAKMSGLYVSRGELFVHPFGLFVV
jgi:hypothetical protein